MSVEKAFKILTVNHNADRAEIKEAYRKLTKLVHPDTSHMNTNEIMKEVNEAYEVLKKHRKV